VYPNVDELVDEKLITIHFASLLNHSPLFGFLAITLLWIDIMEGKGSQSRGTMDKKVQLR
jgi:hypothetical protein